jgi:hypothetical protein
MIFFFFKLKNAHIYVWPKNVEERVLVSRSILDQYNLYEEIENFILNSIEHFRRAGPTSEKMVFFFFKPKNAHIYAWPENVEERVLVSQSMLDEYNLYEKIENFILNSIEHFRRAGPTSEKMILFFL